MSIRVLPPAVAAGIAAGEVIERPASVVTELVENSIDAGGATVAVDLKQGGLQSIRVTDDGCGIPADEAEIAFQRHSTSKLQSLDDLSSLSTFGFRGEALASVAAAAHVTMVTRTADAESGTLLELEGGVVLRRGRQPSAPGTVVEVEALFATIPARLKFIRSPSAETARVRRVLDHMALAHPHVRFTLRTENRTLLQTPGNGYLRDVIAAVHGPDLAAAMLDIAPSTQAPYRAHGLAAPPEQSRPNRTGVSLFVNGRWVQSRMLSAAVEEAYTGFLMEGRYPIAVLFLEVPPAEIDVNVHPNKREVRFIRDGDAFASIQRAVREALLAASPIAEAGAMIAQPRQQPTPTFPVAPPSFAFQLGRADGVTVTLPEPEPISPTMGPTLEGRQADEGPAAGATSSSPPAQPGAATAAGVPPLRVLGQIASSYIVAEGADGMYLIDQHAAHESVLYYRLLRQWEASRPEIQPLLDPLPVDLPPEDLEAIDGARSILERYGLLLEPFGEGTWLLRAVPVMARQVNAQRLIAEVLEKQRHGLLPAESHLSIAASIACHSAVRAGQALDQQEMEALAHALAAGANPQHCPHGRPTTLRVTTGMLERQFGRT